MSVEAATRAAFEGEAPISLDSAAALALTHPTSTKLSFRSKMFRRSLHIAIENPVTRFSSYESGVIVIRDVPRVSVSFKRKAERRSISSHPHPHVFIRHIIQGV